MGALPKRRSSTARKGKRRSEVTRQFVEKARRVNTKLKWIEKSKTDK